MSTLDFVSFFTDIHGHSPFPWQERLAALLVENHTWPDLVDLPTASGKTACIDIALFHLAWCADMGEPWRAARRIAFVVDRRIIVDSAAERAEHLCAQLEQPQTEAVNRVSVALRKLGGESSLVCYKLRGGMPRERSFARDPAQPLIVTSTVDQIGSRLLFRGYGLSRYTHPIHAGLLAYDTVLLVDEAHLSQPFLETIAGIQREQSRAERPLKFAQPLRVVPLSATAKSTGERFQLSTLDLTHPMLAERRTAAKPAQLADVSSKAPERLKVLLREALEIYKSAALPSPAVAVIVNRVRTARALYEALQAEGDKEGFEVELLMGRSRPLNRDDVSRRVLARVGAGRNIESNEHGLIVVATQTIEVGADLDFHGLVTECASIDALRQRFGRLDRMGKFRNAKAVIVGGGESEDDPVYGFALVATWNWLKSVAQDSNGRPAIDFSIEAMEKHIATVDMEPMTARPGERLTLTPIHVDLLSQTSPPPMFDPDVQAFLHGLNSGPPEVQILWRSDLPLVATDNGSVLDDAEVAVAARVLELNPPSSLESISLPLLNVRTWLQRGKEGDNLADQEGTVEDDDDGEWRKAGRTDRGVLRQRGSGGWERVFPHKIKPGDTIVVPSTYGGCDEFGFAPGSSEPVTDLSARARRALDRSTQLIITEQWLAATGLDIASRQKIWRQLTEARQLQMTPAEVLTVLLDEVDDLVLSELEWLAHKPIVDMLFCSDGELYAIVATEAIVRPGDLSDEDLSSSRTVPVSLTAHNAGVGKRAEKLGEVLSLDAAHVMDLACAGSLHDLGKADPRFQHLLRLGDNEVLPGQLLAKGVRRTNASHVRLGERHEAYSVAFLKQYPDLLSHASDPDLALYLIGTHHGRGRSLMPDHPDAGVEFAVDLGDTEYRYEGTPALGALGSGWPTLFWRMTRRYGPWGLAYLESVLRLADWLRSAEELQQGAK